MKKCIALSTAVLAATFAFAPLAGAQQAGRENGQAAEGQENQGNFDQHFVKNASADNLFEVQAGQFVEQHAQNQQVKQLAQRLVQDHQRAQQQLEQAARQANIQVPSQLEQWQQAKLQMMQQMAEKHPGEIVDSSFAFDQVGAHRTDILCYQFEADHTQNAQLKEYAQQTIPVLQEHLQMAEQAAEQWVPQARTAGEHIQGNSGANENNAPSSAKGGSGTNEQGTPSGGGNQGTNR